MGRLTEKDASGRWQVKGLPWEKLQAGETLTEETSQILYGCLCRLNVIRQIIWSRFRQFILMCSQVQIAYWSG